MRDVAPLNTAKGLSQLLWHFTLKQASACVFGICLLVAMIGAIVLTLRHRGDIKRQNISSQILRDPKEQMELKDIKPGQGL